MKKLFLFVLVALCLTSCKKSDQITEPAPSDVYVIEGVAYTIDEMAVIVGAATGVEPEGLIFQPADTSFTVYRFQAFNYKFVDILNGR